MSDIDPTDARRRLDSGEAVLVDVREPSEWEAGHASGALHRPLADLDPAEFAGRSVITTCRGGGRGTRAAEALTDAGVDAANLGGGLRAWSEAGGALVRDDGSPGGLD
ncbi:rhodanese-like domain-containing protein [Actinomycetospora endophytica]|uniref:Rhodanese-like domain-containing protein n=1 Tax=Actinomycetospora endophytica TaxID=2291215 RepID=A0ABS8P1Y0_9PSEU|nr:rhodanese-like domain-containing protein [Actinomycetospora endophytica]MCD2192094.1 rhodanese-like domain-containing protein [Actinomycetospora endophytica]